MELEKLTGGQCSEGYEQAFLSTFPGTEQGCNCLGIQTCDDTSVFRLDRVNVGSCEAGDSTCGCTNVSPYSARQLTLWPNEIELCLLRDKELSYNNIWYRGNSEGECENGFKKCGNVSGQSKGVCIPDTKNCPITSVIFASANPNSTEYPDSITGETLNVYYSRTHSQDPLTELQVGEGHICLNSNKNGATPDRKPYILLKYQEAICTPDERFTKTGLKATEKDVLLENNVDIDTLPNFNPSIEHKYFGFERSMITFKPSCRSQI